MPSQQRRFIMIVAVLAFTLVLTVLSFTSAFAQDPPAAPGDQAASGATSSGGEGTSFARAFFVSEGSYLGTALIWFLMLLSALSLGLMGYLWINNRRINILPAGMVIEVRHLIETKRYKTLIDLSKNETSFFSRILAAALGEASHGFSAMVRALEQAGDEYTTRRLRQIEVLNVLGNVAPMIGLFGTVYGMILAFQGIVSAGGRPDPVDLAAGIGTALTTTFWGLVVAIPSLAAYALIRNNIDALTSEATLVAEEIVNSFRPGPGGAAAGRSTGAAAAPGAPTAASSSASGSKKRKPPSVADGAAARRPAPPDRKESS